MKISIEFKDKKYRITYGKVTGMGVTVKEAMKALMVEFEKDLEKFFVQ